MSLIEVRSMIISSLRIAAWVTHRAELITILNNIEAGANPKDLIGVRWDTMLFEKWHRKSIESLIPFIKSI